MRQRLGIAQALINNPKLLILDEPTNGLDPKGKIEFRELIKKLAKRNDIAIMISSHNLAEIESCCNKICIIKEGKIIETTTMNRLKMEMKGCNYIIKINDTNLLNNVSFKFEIIDEDHILVNVEESKIPKIVEELVSKKIRIYTIEEKNESLEDAFIKKIGGKDVEETN